MGRMAILYSKNRLKLNEVFVNESITGQIFRCRPLKEIQLGSYKAVIPELTGTAYIMGFNHLVLDPEDPFGTNGFVIGKPI
jgi:proline racemase